MFTARNRQNAFAKRRRAQAEAAAAETVAILADAETTEAIAEAGAETMPAAAAPFHRNTESGQFAQAPDISTYATGGIVETTPEETAAADELSQLGQEIDAEMSTPQHVAVPVLSPGLQAKIDAIANRAIPSVADERPDHPGPRGAEHMRPLTESEPVADKPSMLDTLIETMPSEQGRAPIAEPETAPEDEPKRGRGRPRPQETIDRDNAVHALLVGADAETGISKESIAAELDEKEQQVYSSLRQLTKEGRAETRYVKPHGYRWFAL